MLYLRCAGCGGDYPEDDSVGVGFWPFERAFASRALCLPCVERVPLAARRPPLVAGDVVLSRHERIPRPDGAVKWIMDATDTLFAIPEPVARILFPGLFREVGED